MLKFAKLSRAQAAVNSRALLRRSIATATLLPACDSVQRKQGQWARNSRFSLTERVRPNRDLEEVASNGANFLKSLYPSSEAARSTNGHPHKDRMEERHCSGAIFKSSQISRTVRPYLRSDEQQMNDPKPALNCSRRRAF